MTEYDILDAIGDIDPAYLEEAKDKSFHFRKKWIGIGSLAACLLIFFICPLAHQYYWLNYESLDYVATEDVECCVYYVQNHALYYESVGVRGGDVEMFEVWKSKNGITKKGVLQNIVLLPAPNEPDQGSKAHYETVCVTVSSSLKNYFENEDGAWREESLKKTIESYRRVTIDTLEMIFV